MVCQQSDNIPIVYAYIYYHLKKRTNASIVLYSDVKSISGRALIRHGGFPKRLIKYVIQDMVKLGLLKKNNSRSFILVENDCDKRIKNILFLF